jgi:hypothetical protein
MNLPLILRTFAALQVERATAPSFRGEGDGKLVVLEVPENVSPGGGGEVAVRSEISLRSFPPGEYLLRTRITDEETGEVAERESPFIVRTR